MIAVWIIDFDLPGAVLGAVEPDFELAASHTCASLSLYAFSALYATLIIGIHSGDLSDGSGSQSC
jgi:hypothetical protein